MTTSSDHVMRALQSSTLMAIYMARINFDLKYQASVRLSILGIIKDDAKWEEFLKDVQAHGMPADVMEYIMSLDGETLLNKSWIQKVHELLGGPDDWY